MIASSVRRCNSAWRSFDCTELALQRGVAIDLAIDLEPRMQRGHLAETASLVGLGVATHVFVEIRIGRDEIAERGIGVSTQLEQRRHLAGRHVDGAIRKDVIERDQGPRRVALGKVDLREERTRLLDDVHGARSRKDLQRVIATRASAAARSPRSIRTSQTRMSANATPCSSPSTTESARAFANASNAASNSCISWRMMPRR